MKSQSDRAARAVWLGCVALLGAAACQKKEESAPPELAAAKDAHRDEPEHAELPTRVRLSDAVIRDARLVTAAVAREPLAVTLALPGEVAADPDKAAELASPIAGRIERILFQEGSVVKKGDVLAVIGVADLGRLRAEQASALARATAARAHQRRQRDLFAQRLTTEQSLLDAEASASALELEARAASDRLGALGLDRDRGRPSALTLRAPLSGVVVSRHAVVGQPVTAEQVICQIVDLSELWFLGRVFEKDLGRLKQRAAAEVQLNAYPKQRLHGTVEYIGRQVDPIARTVTARIRLDNTDDMLRVGLFGTAYVSVSDADERAQNAREPTLVVPRSALIEVFGKQVVFVRQADQDFELHEVTLGDSAAGKVQVLAGLREGEQVVVEGAFTLKSAVLKSTFAEEE